MCIYKKAYYMSKVAETMIKSISQLHTEVTKAHQLVENISTVSEKFNADENFDSGENLELTFKHHLCI